MALNRLTSLLAAALLAAASPCARPAAAQQREEKDLLTNDRVIAMVKNGVSEGIILALIEKFPERLDGGPEALVELKAAGASNKVLLAVRRSGLASQAAAEDAANPVISDQPGEQEEGQPEEEAGGQPAGPRPHPFSGGDLSLGLGYPFVAAKYDFLDYALEARYLDRRAKDVRVFSGRAYWNFRRAGPWTGYVGGEAGYVGYGAGRFSGHAWELAPFLGGGYEFHKDLTLTMDVAPTLIFFDGGGSDFGLGELGWYVNIGVFFRLPKLEPRSGSYAEEANTAAMDKEKADSDLAAWRLQRGPAKRATYDERLAAAARYISQKDYPEADQEYAAALESLKETDERQVFLHERRGWVALKQDGPEAAKGHYLEAIAAARRLEAYGSDLVNAYCGLAYVFEKLEQNDLAIRNYEKALDIAPSEAVRRQIGKALRRLRTGDTGD